MRPMGRLDCIAWVSGVQKVMRPVSIDPPKLGWVPGRTGAAGRGLACAAEMALFGSQISFALSVRRWQGGAPFGALIPGD